MAQYDFRAELRVPAPEPVASYTCSLPDVQAGPGPASVAAAVVARLFPAGAGTAAVTGTHSSCLICQ